MDCEVGLVSLTHLQNLVQYSQLNRVEYSLSDCAWMQNNNDKKQVLPENDDDSWEVRAFEEDMTGNIMGCTWPPRFYTCTYCRREFRSAQALGGHMNVHRRDRAKLREVSPTPPSSTVAKSTCPSAFLIPGQEFVANGLCLLYSLPNPNNGFFMTPKQIDTSMDSPAPLFSKSIGIPLICNHSSNTQPLASTNSNDNNESIKESSPIEDIDLELRLGCRSPPPQEER